MGPSIKATLGLDTKEFASKMQAVKAQATALASSLSGVFSIAIGAGALKSIADYSDQIVDLADRYRVSTDALQKFSVAAETSGSSLEGLSKGLGKLTLSQAQAVEGNEDLRNAFATLGVDVDRLAGMNTEELFQQIAKGNLDAAAAAKVFGKSALELLPTLRAIGDGTATIGKSIDEAKLRRFADFVDQFKAFKQMLTVDVGNAIGDMFDRIEEGAIMTRGILHDLFNGGDTGWKAGKQVIEETRKKRAERSRPKGIAEDAEGADSGGGSGGGSGGNAGAQAATSAWNRTAEIGQQMANNKEDRRLTPRQRIARDRAQAEARLKQMRGQFDPKSLGTEAAAQAEREIAEQALTLQGLQDQERAAYVQEQLMGPDGRRQAKRDQRKARQLGDRFDRVDQLGRRGGMSKQDFEMKMRGATEALENRGAPKDDRDSKLTEKIDELIEVVGGLTFVTPSDGKFTNYK